MPATYELERLDANDTEDGITNRLLPGTVRYSGQCRIGSSHTRPSQSKSATILFPVRALGFSFAVSFAWTTILWWRYHYQTTVPIFVGSALFISSAVVLSWYHVLQTALVTGIFDRRAVLVAAPSRIRRSALMAGSVLVLWWIFLLVSPTPDYPLPDLSAKQDKYLIAADLYNNEVILPDWMAQLEALIKYLGRDNVYISLYESNSEDATPIMLRGLGRSLDDKGIRNRIISFDHDGRDWGTELISNERIVYLSRIRNIVLEPISSADPLKRISDWQQYTKIIYLNDVVYRWQDIAGLIGTTVVGKESETYDMVCGLDHWNGGFYDIWVARDICGTPFRRTWPYTKNPESVRAIRRDEPFEVSACWNGAVVLNAEPFLYQAPPGGDDLSAIANSLGQSRHLVPLHLLPRMSIIGQGEPPVWRMIDNATHQDSQYSPALHQPLRFRHSGIDDCVHSECFLLAYDLHRRAAAEGRRPRIWVNPTVNLAYEVDVYRWDNIILRKPIIQWWRTVWSHGISHYLFDAKTERNQRVRDQCTWAALQIPTRCGALPGSLVDGDRVF